MYSLPKRGPNALSVFATDSGDRSLPAARQSRWCLSASKIRWTRRIPERDRGNMTAGATDRRETRFQFQEIFPSFWRTLFEVWRRHQRIKSTFIDLSIRPAPGTLTAPATFCANTPSRFRQNFLTTSTCSTILMSASLAQDEWRLKPNLTFSYGMRWEDENILRDLNNFGPRVAFAYDPFKPARR